jgi:hypothetical protein
MAIPPPQHKVQEDVDLTLYWSENIPVAVLCWANGFATGGRSDFSRKRDVRCNRGVLNFTEGVHITVSTFERMSIFDKAGPDPKVRATS